MGFTTKNTKKEQAGRAMRREQSVLVNFVCCVVNHT
jgi:hypothetical protein